ncbi:Polysaccharide deacetylase [Chitinophaga sp. CF118]|uniref:polysaccharide deacetylase family protein n=1 Tax=Chitinophaga sp. CF118 TaxID=1884367 RepID=UPI0008EAA781|nr:polysaccharide deacetylase family protein [Chitinophaga sp. CF118]SFE92721.1 Polysaccharide deacetylase [Chitinophaga sp. CF118]
MSLAKNAFYGAVRLLPMKMLRNKHTGALLLPYHHLVSDKEVPHIKHLYPFKGTRAFEQDLDYLLKHFIPVTLQDVITCLKAGQPLPERSFLLTFDDGLREVTENIAPLLIKKGVPAAFFLNSAFLDNKNLFYKFKISLIIESLMTGNHSEATLNKLAETMGAPVNELVAAMRSISYNNQHLAEKAGIILGLSFEDYLWEQRPFMTLDEVGALVKQGFAIGGHSVDHPYYTQLTLEEQLAQTRESVDFLTTRFNLSYRAFAFPHSDAGVSRTFFETLLNTSELDIILGTANHKKDISPFILHRFNCERPAISIDAAVKGIFLYNHLQELRGKNIITR